MLSWLVDHAVLLYVLLGCVAAAFAAGWWMTRQAAYLGGLAIAVGLILLVWLLTLFILTDRQQLERNIREMAAGVTLNKPENVAKHLSREFSYGRVTRATAATEIGAAIQRFQLKEIYVWDVDVEHLSRSEGKATVAFRVRVDAAMGQQMYLCRGEFVLEDEQWRMKDFKLYNPVVNSTQPLEIPLP